MSIFNQSGMGNFGGGGYGGRRSGCATLIGIAIILFGVIRYFTATSVNPVTGEKQHLNMLPEQETALGLQSAPQMAAEMGGEVDASDPDTQTVQRVGAFVVAHSAAAKSPYEFHFHLLRDPNTVNAFALPGGQVFITRGLFSKLSDEAELAGVLGHETGHVVERHSAQQMAKGELGQALVTGIGVAASDRNNGYSAAMIAQFVEQTAMLHYSRNDESQADAFGLRVMTEAGFDPRAMIDVMKILQQVSGQSRTPQFLETHPDPGNRIEAIEQWLKDHPDRAKDLTRGGKLR